MNQAVTVIYIDTLFLLNAVVNYLILLATAKICNMAIKRWRIAVGAGVGAVYAVIAFMPQTHFVSAFVMQIAVSAVIAIIAFGVRKQTVRAGVVFWAVGLMFGGCVEAVNILAGYRAGMVVNNVPYMHINVRVLLLTSGFFYAVLTLIFKGAALKRRQSGVEVCIESCCKTVTLHAMHDSGNSLTDPATGVAVMIADCKALYPLWSSEVRSLLTREGLSNDPAAVLLALSELKSAKFRLLPYTSVGTEGGFLLGFKPDKLTIDGKAADLLIALSPTPIENGKFAAIINPA